MATTELLMVRHGQSEANVGTSTDPDCGLTELGMEQARAAARRLAGFDLRDCVGVTSPYRRAVSTAEAISLTTGLTFTPEPAVREWGPMATVGALTFEPEPVEQAAR